MLRVVSWLWTPYHNYRTKFTVEHVNTLRNMVERHYHDEHEFVCITDQPKGLDDRIRVIPIWDTFAKVLSPWGGSHPACYRRLRAFSSEMADIIGPRFVSVDLDVVIVGDVTPLWNRKEDFVIWASPLRNTPYNGSMWLMNAGAREEVYTKFHPEISPQLARKAGMVGSDQAWMVYQLGPDEATWTAEDGVLAWRTDLRRRRYRLPGNARMVFFQGFVNPWDQDALREPHAKPWIEAHYR